MNVGFGQDKLLTNDGNKWPYKNKGCGMMGVTASLWLGVLCNMAELWVIVSFNPLLPPPQSGVLLTCGVVNCGVRNECDPALVLLSDDVVHHTNIING